MDESDSSVNVALLAILAVADIDAYELLIDEIHAKIDMARRCAIAEAIVSAAFAAQDAYDASMTFADGTGVRMLSLPDPSTADPADVANEVVDAGLRAVRLASRRPGPTGERAVNAGVKAVYLGQEIRRIAGVDPSMTKESSSPTN